MKTFVQDGKTFAKRSELTGWERNPRSISKDRFEELKSRIKRQGQFRPVVVTMDGVVVGGNMRLRAFADLGIEDIWVSPVEANTNREMFDLALTDNESMGYYEQEQVAELALELGLTELELDNYELSLGDPTSLGSIIDKFGPTPEEDEVPELDELNPPVSKLGEVYQLGPHRLMCGDATDFGMVSELMNDKTADMVFTDPPYGVNYQSNMRTKSVKFDIIEGDDEIITDWIEPLVSVSRGFVFIWTSWKVLGRWLEATNPIGEMTNMIVWDKGGGGIGDLQGTYSSDYEVALVFNRGAKLTGKRLGSVWDIGKDGSSTYEHPIQKPTSLAAQAIRTTTNVGNIVLDVFGGSGSTLIAADATNRICYMMELDPKYCDVIRKRYAKHIGEEDKWQEVTQKIK